MWDLRTLSMVYQVPWSKSSEETSKIYSAKFINPSKQFIIAAGADKNVAKVISLDTGKAVSVFEDFTKPCLVTDSSADGTLCLIGCADGTIHVKNFMYS